MLGCAKHSKVQESPPISFQSDGMGCNFTDGEHALAFLPASVDAAEYQKILSTVLVPVVTAFPRPWFFQQDNARPHVAKTTLAWFKSQAVVPQPIPWPPYSPDVSPIENMWSVIQNDVNHCNPDSIPVLKLAISRCWRQRTSDPAFMQSLLGGWRGRIVQLVATKGASLQC